MKLSSGEYNWVALSMFRSCLVPSGNKTVPEPKLIPFTAVSHHMGSVLGQKEISQIENGEVIYFICFSSLLWRHNGRDSVSSHQPHDCLFNYLFRRRWKKRSKLRVTGLCVWNSLLTSEFSAQISSNAENVSIWWRHHDRKMVRNSAKWQLWYDFRSVMISR